MKRYFNKRKGFTLVEVLVALLIVAVTLGAGLRALNQATDLSGSLDKRMIARWIAEDHIALMRAQRIQVNEGRNEGRITQAGMQWVWTESIEKQPRSPFQKITVTVREDQADTHSLAHLSAFILQSPP
jgi:general secretion pathway protein I